MPAYVVARTKNCSEYNAEMYYNVAYNKLFKRANQFSPFRRLKSHKRVNSM